MSEHELFDGKLPGAENRPETEEIFAPFVPDEDHYIFVSYSHADRERVFPIITRLYEKGWHVWYDQGLELGENYYVELARHIQNCDAFLLFITENAVKSDFVSNNEVLYACNRSKVIIQCRLDKDACFPEEANEALELATASKKHPKTDEAWLEVALLSIKGLPRFSPRIAEGYQVRVKIVDIPIAEESDEYEFVMCVGGVRLGRYLGDKSEVTVPVLYKGFPVIGLGETFTESKTVKTVHVSEGIQLIHQYCFRNKYLTNVFLPNSINSICEPQGIAGIVTILNNTDTPTWTLHCEKDSFVHKHLHLFGEQITLSLKNKAISQRIPQMYSEEPYAFCSYTKNDYETVQSVLQKLAENGCIVKDSSSTDEYERIRTYNNAVLFLAFVSQHYLSSGESEYLRLARSTGKASILYVLDECHFPEELSMTAENEQQLRYDSGTEIERLYKLVHYLRKNGCCKKTAVIPDYEYIADTHGITLMRYTGNERIVQIPEYCFGVPVIALGDFIFEDKEIAFLTIPDSVSSIGIGAIERITTVTCSEGSVAWDYCKKEGIPHRTPAGDYDNSDSGDKTEFTLDMEDILRIFK